MLHIRFNRKRTDGKQTAIRCIVRLNGQRQILATGISVNPAEWDAKRERSKTDPHINQKLENIRQRIAAHVASTGQPPESLQQPAPELPDMLASIRAHGAHVVARTGSKNTGKAYQTLCAKLTQFHREKKRREKTLADITPNYLNGFLRFMSRYSNTHANKMWKTLKAVCRGKIEMSAFNGIHAPTPEDADTIRLTPRQIADIENADLKPGGMLDHARTLFLAGCYTGLRYCDWHQIRAENTHTIAGKTVLTVTQQKTKNPVSIPVSQRLQNLMQQHPDGLPKMSNQNANSYLKIIAQKAGIPDWQKVTTHTARRSFATNAVLEGIPPLDVMQITGHRTIASFLRYIRLREHETALRLANHPFFK